MLPAQEVGSANGIERLFDGPPPPPAPAVIDPVAPRPATGPTLEVRNTANDQPPMLGVLANNPQSSLLRESEFETEFILLQEEVKRIDEQFNDKVISAKIDSLSDQLHRVVKQQEEVGKLLESLFTKKAPQAREPKASATPPASQSVEEPDKKISNPLELAILLFTKQQKKKEKNVDAKTDYTKAKEAFQDATVRLKTGENWALAHYMIAVCLHQQGDLQAAKDKYISVATSKSIRDSNPLIADLADLKANMIEKLQELEGKRQPTKKAAKADDAAPKADDAATGPANQE